MAKCSPRIDQHSLNSWNNKRLSCAIGKLNRYLCLGLRHYYHSSSRRFLSAGLRESSCSQWRPTDAQMPISEADGGRHLPPSKEG